MPTQRRVVRVRLRSGFVQVREPVASAISDDIFWNATIHILQAKAKMPRSREKHDENHVEVCEPVARNAALRSMSSHEQLCMSRDGQLRLPFAAGHLIPLVQCCSVASVGVLVSRNPFRLVGRGYC